MSRCSDCAETRRAAQCSAVHRELGAAPLSSLWHYIQII